MKFWKADASFVKYKFLFHNKIHHLQFDRKDLFISYIRVCINTNYVQVGFNILFPFFVQPSWSLNEMFNRVKVHFWVKKLQQK